MGEVPISLTSNAEHSQSLFAGFVSGRSRMYDLPTQKIVREFVPRGLEHDRDSVCEVIQKSPSFTIIDYHPSLIDLFHGYSSNPAYDHGRHQVRKYSSL